jgi:amphi-Trp domain-containing protein
MIWFQDIIDNQELSTIINISFIIPGISFVKINTVITELINLEEKLMAKKNVIVKSDLRKNLPEVAAFIRELADKVETGQVTLVQSGQDVVIDLPETVSFELEYYEQPKKRGLKKQIEIELQWTEGDQKRESVTLG